jgi:hypothetical protein
MKHIVFFLLFTVYLALPLLAQEQSLRTESLADINLRFELPQPEWSNAQVKKTKSESTIYTYTRKLKEDKKTGQATLSVFVEHIKPSTTIREYSNKGLLFFQKQKGFKINKTFVDADGRFSLPYTIGYDAEYVDANQKKHHVYILHTIEFNHGAQLLLDFPEEYYLLYEEEQTKIIQSLRYER